MVGVGEADDALNQGVVGTVSPAWQTLLNGFIERMLVGSRNGIESMKLKAQATESWTSDHHQESFFSPKSLLEVGKALCDDIASWIDVEIQR